jgi:hypothetical protein
MDTVLKEALIAFVLYVGGALLGFAVAVIYALTSPVIPIYAAVIVGFALVLIGAMCGAAAWAVRYAVRNA